MLATNRSKLPLATALVLVAGFFLVRTIAIDRVAGTDDEAWLWASAILTWNLYERDFAETHQWTHPGVPILWSGLLAFLTVDPKFPVNVPISGMFGIYENLRAHLDVSPMDVMVIARIYKLLFQSLLFLLGLNYLKELFGFRVMVLTGGLIVFEPFLSGNDTLLVPDGFFASALLVAVLSLTIALKSGFAKRRPWVVAGALTGLAIVTRTTGIVMLPVLGACIVLALLLNRPGPGQVKQTIRNAAISVGGWIGAGVITGYALWPGIWVSPVRTFRTIWDYAVYSATEGHENPVFFNGQTHGGDPGWNFYPEAFVWRLTPAVTLGLIILAGWMIRCAFKARGTITLSYLVPALVLCVLFCIGMTLGAKKFDRYLIPIFPLIMLFAAVGFDRAIAALEQVRSFNPRVITTVTIALIIGLQAVATVQSLPYRLDYYNPFLGGAKEAQQSMQMGWGEGADEVLAWIDQTRTSDDPIVVGAQNSSAFTYVAPDGVVVTSETYRRAKAWYQQDYYVMSIQWWQRTGDPLAAIAPPVHTIKVSGIDFFRIYKIEGTPYPPSFELRSQCRVDFFNGLKLMDVAEEGDQLAMYWLTDLPTAPGTFQVVAELLIPGMPQDHSRFEGNATWEPVAGGFISRVAIDVPGLTSRPSGQRPLTISLKLVDTESSAVLPGTPLGADSASATLSLTSDCHSRAIQ